MPKSQVANIAAIWFGLSMNQVMLFKVY